MIDPKKCQHIVDDLAKKLTDAIPDGLKHVKGDLQASFHAILQNTFAKLDLVTREEFDTQAAVLAKTRSKIDTLEKTVTKLEEKLGITTPEPVDREHD